MLTSPKKTKNDEPGDELRKTWFWFSAAMDEYLEPEDIAGPFGRSLFEKILRKRYRHLMMSQRKIDELLSLIMPKVDTLLGNLN